jgi:hypothetical protein
LAYRCASYVVTLRASYFALTCPGNSGEWLLENGSLVDERVLLFEVMQPEMVEARSGPTSL